VGLFIVSFFIPKFVNKLHPRENRT
jgi:hypothetical protein